MSDLLFLSIIEAARLHRPRANRSADLHSTRLLELVDGHNVVGVVVGFSVLSTLNSCSYFDPVQCEEKADNFIVGTINDVVVLSSVMVARESAYLIVQEVDGVAVERIYIV